MNMLTPRRERSGRIVVNVRERFRAASGICRELMNRRKLNSAFVRYDRFRSVAVMSIKVPNSNAFSAVFQCVEGRNGDIAKITETHRAIARGMMSGRSHQAKCGFGTQRGARCFNRRAGRVTRVRLDVRITRRGESETFSR